MKDLDSPQLYWKENQVWTVLGTSELGGFICWSCDGMSWTTANLVVSRCKKYQPWTIVYTLRGGLICSLPYLFCWAKRVDILAARSDQVQFSLPCSEVPLSPAENINFGSTSACIQSSYLALFTVYVTGLSSMSRKASVLRGMWVWEPRLWVPAVLSPFEPFSTSLAELEDICPYPGCFRTWISESSSLSLRPWAVALVSLHVWGGLRAFRFV